MLIILHDSRLKLEAGVKKRSWTGKMMLTGNGTERDKGGLCCVGICKRSRCFYNITAKYLSTAFVKRQALAAAASKIPGGPLPSNGCSFPVCAKKNAGEWGLRWSNRPSCGVCHCYWREEQQDRCVGADGGWMVAQAKLISALKKLMTINENYFELPVRWACYFCCFSFLLERKPLEIDPCNILAVRWF